MNSIVEGTTRYLTKVLLAVSFVACAACAEPIETEPPNGEPADPSEPVTGDNPAFLIQVETQTLDGTRFVYLAVVEDIADPVDLTEAIEFGGTTRLLTAFGDVFAFEAESLEITRFDVGEDRSLTELDEFTMSGLGITSYQASTLFLSETTAVYVDAPTRQFVWWNPSALEIIEAVPFPMEGMPEGLLVGQPTLSFDGQTIIVPIYNIDFTTLESVHGARVLLVPVDDRQAVSMVVDERCPYSSLGGVIDPSSGDYIFVGDALQGFANHYSIPSSGAGCLLRIRDGEAGFDPDFMVEAASMNPEGFDDLAGFIIADDQFLALFRDEITAPIAELTNPGSYFGGEGSAFAPYVGSTSDFVGTRVPNTDGQNWFGFPSVVDEDLIVIPANIDDRGPDSTSNVYRMTSSGAEVLVEQPGFVRRIDRIR